jgi:alanyl-tRNA synthetase
VIENFRDVYPNVLEQKETIIQEIDKEEKQFITTLEN